MDSHKDGDAELAQKALPLYRELNDIFAGLNKLRNSELERQEPFDEDTRERELDRLREIIVELNQIKFKEHYTKDVVVQTNEEIVKEMRTINYELKNKQTLPKGDVITDLVRTFRQQGGKKSKRRRKPNRKTKRRRPNKK